MAFEVGDWVQFVSGRRASVEVLAGHAALRYPSNPGSSLRRYRVLIDLDVAVGDLRPGAPASTPGGRPYTLKNDLGTVTITENRRGEVVEVLDPATVRTRFHYPLVRGGNNAP